MGRGALHEDLSRAAPDHDRTIDAAVASKLLNVFNQALSQIHFVLS
jgi:hypothetical protein